MAELVGAFAVPHTPHFPNIVAGGGAGAEEIARLYREVERRLRAVEPEAIVLLTSDHYNLFFEQLPIFAIGAGGADGPGSAAPGPSDYPELPHYDVPIADGLARSIHRSLVAEDFDVALLQELSVDHTVTVPLHFLRPAMDVPVVPFYTSVFMRPIPSARRCLALGEGLRRAIEGAEGPERIVVLATGSFSLEIGGPRISDTSHTGVPDPGWVERVCELLRAGDVDRLVEEASDEQLDRAGSAGGELLDWIILLGACRPGPTAFLEAQMQHGHAYAAWT